MLVFSFVFSWNSLSQQFTRTIQKNNNNNNNNNASHRLNCIDIVALYSAYNINESMGSHVEVDGLLIEEDRGDVLSPEEISDLISKYSGHEIVKNVLECASLEELNEKASIANDRLHKLESESIKEHAKECDNLVHLQEKIQNCDETLAHIENVLSNFQSNLGKISGEISNLQSSSSHVTQRLLECKETELALGEYVEQLTISPDLIAKVLSTEVGDGTEYIQVCKALSEKLIFKRDVKRRGGEDATYAAFTDIESELERLRIKAIQKIRDFFIQKFHSLRKPKTNIQLLQTNVLKKYKPLVDFLQVHGADIFREIRALYVETMGKVLKMALQNYISALSVLKLESRSSSKNKSGQCIGDVDTSASSASASSSPATLLSASTSGNNANANGDSGGGSSSHFLSSLGQGSSTLTRNDGKNMHTNFSLGKRANILANLETAAPIIAHSNSGSKLSWEVLFRSSQKLLVDMATFEYLFCIDFWKGDSQIFRDVFAQPLQVIDEYVQSEISTNFDAIGLALAILINRGHQKLMQKRRIPSLDSHLDKVNIMLWPKFKTVFDAHIKSVVSASENAKNQTKLFVDDVSAHYVTRRYAEFTASMTVLSKLEGGDNQLRNNLERLRKAQYDLLVKLSERFTTPKRRSCFLLNNYDLIHQILVADENLEHELGFFDEQLIIETDAFVQIELETHFGDALLQIESLEFGKSSPDVAVEQSIQILKNFSEQWKQQITKINSEIVSLFSNYNRGMDILQRTLSSLLVKYTDACEKTSASGEEAKKIVDTIRVTNAAFLFECKRYARAK